MDRDTKKAIYLNLYLLAAADGKILPAEREYLGRFAELAEISVEVQRKWLGELGSGHIAFRTIENDAARRAGLALMARMIRVDGDFGPEEQTAYINMGKALGLSQETLGAALREYWNRDPLAPKPKATPARSLPKEDFVLAIEDDFAQLESFSKSCASATVLFCKMADLAGVRTLPKFVLFHAAEERKDSLTRLETLTKIYADAPVTFVVRRDQAPQIGYLLERGGGRCFVEPLFPNEIDNALREILGAKAQ